MSAKPGLARPATVAKAPLPRLNPNSFAFTVLLGSLGALPPLSIDMALPALGDIGSSYGVSGAEAAWTLSLFMGGFAIAQLVFGPFSERFGRRPILLVGVTLFAAGGFLRRAGAKLRLAADRALCRGLRRRRRDGDELRHHSRSVRGFEGADAPCLCRHGDQRRADDRAGAGLGDADRCAVARDLFDARARRTCPAGDDRLRARREPQKQRSRGAVAAPLRRRLCPHLCDARRDRQRADRRGELWLHVRVYLGLRRSHDA